MQHLPDPMPAMRSLRSRSAALVLVFSAVVASCGDSATVPIVPTPGPLIPGTWYMHFANDTALPSTISTRTAGVASETTILDSAQLIINADNTYQQRYWYRVFLTGILDRTEVVIDQGTLAASGTDYAFTSNVRTRSFTVTVPSLGNVRTTEVMLFFVGAPPTAGKYKLSHP